MPNEYIITQNNATGTLALPVAPGDTSFSLNTGEGANFQEVVSPSVMYLTMAYSTIPRPLSSQVQVVRVTAHTSGSDTFTCDAVGGSITWPADTLVELRDTSELFDSLKRKETPNVVTTTPYEVTITDSILFINTDTIGSDATVTFPATPLDDQILRITNTGSLGYTVTLDGNGKSISQSPSPLADEEFINYQYIPDLDEWRTI